MGLLKDMQGFLFVYLCYAVDCKQKREVTCCRALSYDFVVLSLRWLRIVIMSDKYEGLHQGLYFPH